MAKAQVDIVDTGSEGGRAVVRIKVLERDLLGSQFTFRLLQKVVVHDSRAVNHEKMLVEKTFLSTHAKDEYEIELPAGRLETYTYKGKHMNVELHSVLIVDDSILFDTKVKDQHHLPMLDKPKVAEGAKSIIEPNDIYHFFANLQALSIHNRVLTLGLLITGSILAIIAVLVGVHDQLVTEPDVWFFSHVNSDGESQSPLVGGVVLCAVVVAGVGYLVKEQLKKYMSIHWKTGLPKRFEPGVGYKVGSLFKAKSRVDLEDITLRIVACNMECGQYRRGSGSNVRTVSFREPIRGVVLFEKTVNKIFANAQINHWFSADKVYFDDMFRVLYPANMLGGEHGMDVHWELQLIHPEFLDRELLGSKRFAYKDFLEDEFRFKL
jgi:hypothetical protein